MGFQVSENYKALIVCLALLILQGCGTAKVYYDYEYNSAAHEALSPKVDIAVAPAGALVSDQPHAFLYPVIDREVAEYLREAGYNIIPPAEFSAVWEDCIAGTGGIYDPDTGRMHDTRGTHCLGVVFNRLDDTYDPGAVVFTTIVYDRVTFESSRTTAAWGGVVRHIDMEGQRPQGWTGFPVISLSLRVVRTNGELILDNRGGIDFIHKTKTGWTETAAIPKKADEFSAEDVREAVEVAFHPFIASDRVEREPVSAK